MRRLAVLGVHVVKLQRLPGWPDRMVLLPGGISIFCELKRPGQKLRKLQALRKHELEQLGYDVLVIDDNNTMLAALLHIEAVMRGCHEVRAA